MLEQQISKGIMEAMKTKDTVRLSALRNIKKYIIEAKTAGTAVDELPDADVLKIITKLAKQGTDSAAIYAQQNRQDLADEELAQVKVFEEFLPKRLSAEELTEAEAAHPGGADRRGEVHHSRGRRNVDEGDGQGHGCGFEKTCRSGRRQGDLGQGSRIVVISDDAAS